MEKSTLTISDALDIFAEHKNDIRRACVDNILYWQNSLSPAKELDVDSDWAADDIHQHVNWLSVQYKSKPALHVINRIDARRKPKTGNEVTDDMIARAREYPIDKLHEELSGDSCGRGNVSCLFHTDENPSMSLKKNNRYKCFSCDAGGDTIDMYMKVNNVSFLEAVRALQ
jgi:hypothetical protein